MKKYRRRDRCHTLWFFHLVSEPNMHNEKKKTVLAHLRFFIWNDGTRGSRRVLLKLKGERDLNRYTKGDRKFKVPFSLEGIQHTLMEGNIGHMLR